MTDDTQVSIIAAARTAIGRFGGTISRIPVVELGGVAIAAAVERAGIECFPGRISTSMDPENKRTKLLVVLSEGDARRFHEALGRALEGPRECPHMDETASICSCGDDCICQPCLLPRRGEL